MGKPKIGHIVRLNYVLAGIATIAAVLTQSRAVALGIAVGGGLTSLNFFVLEKLIRKWTSDAAKGLAGSSTSYLMLPKMAGLMAAVAVAILVLPLDPIAFVIGYSIFLVSIAIEVMHASFTQDSTTHG